MKREEPHKCIQTFSITPSAKEGLVKKQKNGSNYRVLSDSVLHVSD